MTDAQRKNPDFALNISTLFASIVYGQLFYEKAKLEGIEDDVIDICFSYIVRDNNNYVNRQIYDYAGHLEEGQEEALKAVLRAPNIDFAKENSVLEDYVLALDGEYVYY